MRLRFLTGVWLLLITGVWLLVSQPAIADWTPPADYPPFCTASQPGCFLSVNPSNASQLKLGSLGLSQDVNPPGLIPAGANVRFYSNALGVGAPFVSAPPTATLDGSVSLDVDGDARIAPTVGTTVPVGTSLEVLGVDANGARVAWGSKYFSLWERAQNSFSNNGIYNPDDGGVGVRTAGAGLVDGLTVKGALVRYGGTALVNTLTGSPTTQVNLSTQGQTGGSYSTALGGFSNRATADYSFAGGGQSNRAIGIGSAVVGGSSNQANGDYSFVGGGRSNTASALGSNTAIGGGSLNTVSGTGAAVFGGRSNLAGGVGSVIVGGQSNTASGNYSTVWGGQSNTASGLYSTVIGGQNNTASAAHSLAGGRLMRVDGAQTFAWGNNRAEITANTAKSFIVQPDFGAGSGVVPDWGYAEGSLMIGTSTPFTAGYAMRLNVDGSMVVRGGNPQTGARLTATSALGEAAWQLPAVPPPQNSYGGSVFYLRLANQAANPPNCPTNWCDASAGASGCGGPGQSPMVIYDGPFTNKVRACYRADKRVRVIQFRVPCSQSCNPTEPDSAPVCPVNFSNVYSNHDDGGEYILGTLNKTRVCLSVDYDQP